MAAAGQGKVIISSTLRKAWICGLANLEVPKNEIFDRV